MRSCLVIILCCFFNIAFAMSLETNLSRDKMALGESVIISYTLNGGSINAAPDFSPLEDNFRIRSTHYGSAINILNGAAQAQTLWQLTLEPRKTGQLIVPEIQFGQLKSAERKLVVTENPAMSTAPSEQVSDFVQAEINNKTPYVQSQLLYTFKLFYQSQLENAKIEAPRIKDAVVMPIGNEQSYQATFKGKPYFVFEKHFAIFPQKPGKLTLPPTLFHATTLDTFQGFMSDPFSIPTTKPITLSTSSFTIEVKKTPEIFAGKTWLPANNMTISEEWSADPNDWEVNNPVTRTITIQADGLRADQLPDLPIEHFAGVNIYADPPHRSNQIQNNTVLGNWQQKITYIPNSLQSFTLPAIKFHWWNIQTNANATAELNPITIRPKVNKSQSTSPSTNTTALMLSPVNSTNRSSATAGTVISLAQPFYFSIWFWIASFFLIIWLITLWLVWKKRNIKTISPQTLSTTLNITPSLDENQFAQACEQGDPLAAQKFLLNWSKSLGQQASNNLRQLSEDVQNEKFKDSLIELERALYSNQKMTWNGKILYAAYQQELKLRKQKSRGITIKNPLHKHQKNDPLPPLNP